LRALLLSVQGIGPETADSILLYAGNRPVFVVDLYTRRLLAEWGFATEAQAPYDEVACFFTGHLPSDPALFNEFHALIVRYGKEKRGGALGLRRAIQDPPKA
jgi:endonuclease-3 related protein